MRILPASRASLRPFSDSGQSYHPVKRFSSFHVLSPCRTSTTWYFFSPAIICTTPERPPNRRAVAEAVAAARRRPVEAAGAINAVVLVVSRPSAAARPKSICVWLSLMMMV